MGSAGTLPGDRCPVLEVAQTNLRRHAALSWCRSRARIETTRHRVTDSHGYANFSLPVPGLRVGWHDAHASIAPIEDGETASSTGKSSSHRSGTVPGDLRHRRHDPATGLTEGVAMVARTVLRRPTSEPRSRDSVAVPRPARRIPNSSRQPQTGPTFFYVSPGSWSFYPTLQEFMQLHPGFPRVRCFTDWGPTERYLRRSGRGTKRRSRRLIGLSRNSTSSWSATASAIRT